MRYFVLIFLPFLSIFLQSTFLSFYSIKGAIPNMLLIFVVFYALLNGKRKNAAIYGFLCGLLEDLYIGRFIGINALALGITAFLIASVEGRVFKENLLVGIITVIVGTIINSVILFLLSLISYKLLNLDTGIFINMWYQSLYNLFLAVPIYAWYFHSTKNGLLRMYGEI
ncbi:MAG: rod shape-determining protein MreD [Syntrophomonadaceae bacterium]|nr:rod shape-determining protein MreD [Syntrophomonadaceae bacterium]